MSSAKVYSFVLITGTKWAKQRKRHLVSVLQRCFSVTYSLECQGRHIGSVLRPQLCGH